MSNFPVTTKALRILHLSSRYQWFSLFIHKNLALLLFLLLVQIRKMDQFTTGPTELKAKLLLTSVWRSFTSKCIFIFLFLPHRSGAKWLRVKIMHAFHVKEPELTWCKPHSILTVMTTGEDIPLELHTTATFSFSSASVII